VGLDGGEFRGVHVVPEYDSLSSLLCVPSICCVSCASRTVSLRVNIYGPSIANICSKLEYSYNYQVQQSLFL